MAAVYAGLDGVQNLAGWRWMYMYDSMTLLKAAKDFGGSGLTTDTTQSLRLHFFPLCCLDSGCDATIALKSESKLVRSRPYSVEFYEFTSTDSFQDLHSKGSRASPGQNPSHGFETTDRILQMEGYQKMAHYVACLSVYVLAFAFDTSAFNLGRILMAKKSLFISHSPRNLGSQEAQVRSKLCQISRHLLTPIVIFWVKSYNVKGQKPFFSVAEINIIPLGVRIFALLFPSQISSPDTSSIRLI